MEPEPTIVLPRGCATQGARVLVTARTAREYKRLRDEYTGQRYFMESSPEDVEQGSGRRWFSWQGAEDITIQVACPTPEQEDDLNFEELSRRYKGS